MASLASPTDTAPSIMKNKSKVVSPRKQVSLNVYHLHKELKELDLLERLKETEVRTPTIKSKIKIFTALLEYNSITTGTELVKHREEQRITEKREGKTLEERRITEQSYRRIFAKILAKNILRLRGEGDSVREVQQSALGLFGKASSPHNCHVEMSFLLNHARSVQQGNMFGDAAGVEWKKDPEIKDKKSRAGMNLDRSPRHAAPHAEKRSTTLRKPKPLGIMGSPRDGDDGEFLSSSILIYDNEAGSENVRDGLSRSSLFGDGTMEMSALNGQARSTERTPSNLGNTSVHRRNFQLPSASERSQHPMLKEFRDTRVLQLQRTNGMLNDALAAQKVVVDETEHVLLELRNELVKASGKDGVALEALKNTLSLDRIDALLGRVKASQREAGRVRAEAMLSPMKSEYIRSPRRGGVTGPGNPGPNEAHGIAFDDLNTPGVGPAKRESEDSGLRGMGSKGANIIAWSN